MIKRKIIIKGFLLLTAVVLMACSKKPNSEFNKIQISDEAIESITKLEESTGYRFLGDFYPFIKGTKYTYEINYGKLKGTVISLIDDVENNRAEIIVDNDGNKKIKILEKNSEGLLGYIEDDLSKENDEFTKPMPKLSTYYIKTPFIDNNRWSLPGEDIRYISDTHLKLSLKNNKELKVIEVVTEYKEKNYKDYLKEYYAESIGFIGSIYNENGHITTTSLKTIELK